MLGLGEAVHEILNRNRRRNIIQPLDGPLSANTKLDSAPAVIEGLSDPNDIMVTSAGSSYLCVGNRILRYDALDFRSSETAADLPGEVTGVATHPEGGLVACVAGSGLHFIGGPRAGKVVAVAGSDPLRCLTGVAVAQNGDIFVTDGSRQCLPSDWVVDLINKGRSGRLVHVDAAGSNATVILDGLGFAHGVALTHNQETVVVTESWKHRVLALDVTTSSRQAAAASIPGLDNLPGYPARLCRTGSGYALAVFAMRTQLVDFILDGEDAFRKDMMKRVPRQFWAAPQLYAPGHFLDPVQGGGLKKHGSVNAWAPPRSYGLVLLLDYDFAIIDSFHSRVGGACHGVTGVAWGEGVVYAVSKGCRKVVAISSEIR
jgi:Strictosidine synthase